MRLTVNQKAEFVAANVDTFFASAKTATPEYQESFKAMNVEDQYKVVLRWYKYNEKKANGVSTKRAASRADTLLQDLMCGVKREVSSEKCDELILNFTKAIETLKAIKEENKEREKTELKEQIKQMQARLKELDK